MHKRYRSGFTIVELMIVVAVIGVLASIAYVGFGSAKQKSYDTAVQHDLAKLADELNVYYSDNNSYPINQAALLTVTSTKFATVDYLTTSSKAVLYCVDTASSTSGDYSAVIAQSKSGNAYVVRDETPVSLYSGTYNTATPTSMCQAANPSIATVTSIWIHDSARADSANVSSGGWLVNVL